VAVFLSHCSDSTTDVDALNNEASRLHDLLITPLHIDLSNFRALRFETDGILDEIPFTLLRMPSNSYLGDQFEVSFSPGLAYAATLQPPTAHLISANSRALVVTVSGAESQLAPLPDVSEEGAEVASKFDGAVLIGGELVSRTKVLQALSSAEVFHFAGHAMADARGTGLILGQGSLLSFREFEVSPPRNLRLAVLSACETANGSAGTSADVNSIARTLVAAGVPTVVASRWKVDSRVTRWLMQAFYSNLVSGKTPQDSLRAASRWIRSNPEYQHPYFWASFNVFGSS
jgi:CHAT domain-containing protein